MRIVCIRGIVTQNRLVLVVVEESWFWFKLKLQSLLRVFETQKQMPASSNDRMIQILGDALQQYYVQTIDKLCAELGVDVYRHNGNTKLISTRFIQWCKDHTNTNMDIAEELEN